MQLSIGPFTVIFPGAMKPQRISDYYLISVNNYVNF